jgi:hypothetical protein
MSSQIPPLPTEVYPRQRQNIFLFSKSHRGFILMDTEGPFTTGTAGHEAEKSPPSNTEVKNEWSCASTPTYAFMTCNGTALPAPEPCVLHFQPIEITFIWTIYACRVKSSGMWHCARSKWLFMITALWNVGNHSPNDKASHLRRPEYSTTPLWEPKILWSVHNNIF